MRKLFVLVGLAALALALFGTPSLQAQDGWTAEKLAAWQATAETYYTPDVDPNFMLDKTSVVFDDIKTGMIAPDFALLDMEGNQHTLSEYQGKSFVMVITGSWY